MSMEIERDSLINKLRGEGYLKTESIIQAFNDIPRHDFVLARDRPFAYSDYPLEIGRGQTISAPHMVAIMTELLDPKKTDNVLEIGSGSGYQAAILSRLVDTVVSVELETELAKVAISNLESLGCGNVRVIPGDGSDGYEKEAPYDKIIVTCATSQILKTWKNQLKENGVIIAPVGGYYHQDLVKLTKKRDDFKQESHGGVVFVPLRKG